ncbi:MAG: response regulator transcription factor [Actinomycetota bacterium]
MEAEAARTATRILIVEDDATVAEVVTRYLEREGFSVEVATGGRGALERALTDAPDLMVVDIMLPGMDGLEVCRRVRARAPIPIIMLTALGEESDRVVGLDLGADDYITKPFSPRELTARVKSVLRRARGPLAATSGELRTPLVAGHLEVDIASHEVKVSGRPVPTTAREFELLVFLMLRPNQVFTREDLLQHVWGYTFGDTSTVTVHVRRLREKVEADPAQPELIKTVWGVGYKFEP